jgi:Uma2 family endonuclease
MLCEQTTGPELTVRMRVRRSNHMPDFSKDVTLVAFLPATLIPDRTFTDERLEQIARITLDPNLIRFERSPDCSLRLDSPTPGPVTDILARLSTELSSWLANKNDDVGYLFTRKRFFLRGGVVLCPDIAFLGKYLRDEPELDLAKPLEVCPELVVEICPKTRQFRPLKDKMLRWIASGVGEGWLVVPQFETVLIYRPRSEPEEVNDALIAGHPIDGFVMLLDDIWRVYRQGRKDRNDDR